MLLPELLQKSQPGRSVVLVQELILQDQVPLQGVTAPLTFLSMELHLSSCPVGC